MSDEHNYHDMHRKLAEVAESIEQIVAATPSMSLAECFEQLFGALERVVDTMQGIHPDAQRFLTEDGDVDFAAIYGAMDDRSADRILDTLRRVVERRGA